MTRQEIADRHWPPAFRLHLHDRERSAPAGRYVNRVARNVDNRAG
jgi:hypothetical protein